MTRLSFVVFAAAMTMPLGAFASTDNAAQRLERQVRKELITLPFLTIYDSLSFSVDNGNVVLMGSTIRPTIRSQAEQVVKRIEGVAHVDNRIEVLPLSPFDDSLRIRVARAVYGYGPLNRYAIGANPPIRIVVKNGNVTLEGYVANEMDRNLAFVRANGVAGAFQVKNDLKVDRS
jgi:hypothetical protein